MEKISHTKYTFDHWLKGYPEPDFTMWMVIQDGDNMKINPVFQEIHRAKSFAFDKALEYTLDSIKKTIIEKISPLDGDRRKIFIQNQIDDCKRKFEGFDIRKLIFPQDPNMFENIDGEKYLKVKEQIEGLKNGTYSDCIIYLNNFFTAVLNFELSEFLKGELIVEKIEVEAYTNLPHVLCLLDDLGILELIEEKFSDKYYKGTARHTDHAKLIATILGIEDGEIIRQKLKNKDYLSKKAKQNAVNTLKSLGLEPSKFID